jgi:penicillin-binding protein 2A
MNWRKAVLWAVVAAALAAILVFLTAASYVSSLDVTELGEPMAEPTRILDRNGNEIYKLSVKKSEPVSIERIPETLLKAVIAVEDRRYYEHAGVDMASIARAVYVDIKEREFVEGASTITQQLAKNAFLSPDKTLKRKLKEAAYALKIEMTYDKEQVLERYLNTIYFGEGAWGVQAASRMYFGKDVSDLALEEAALLAGLPKAPSRYSPMDNPEGALERRNIVLRRMREQGYIEEAAFKTASAIGLALQQDTGSEQRGRYASYVDAVLQEAIDRYGLTERQIMAGGWIIATEMDPAVQDAAAAVFADAAQFPVSENGQTVQSGAVFLDQKTGGVRALMGGREEGTYRGFNRAVQLKRQPGSAFKPIAVYGPALEAGYTPYSRLYDGPIDFNGYRPRNWDGRYHGAVTMAEAIRQSWNVPPVWLLERIGVDTGLSFAERLGIELPAEDRNLSIALGGLSQGVSPLQMAQAFSVFASNGMLHEAHFIQRIESAEGSVAGKYGSEPVRAMDENAAFTMTLLLQHAVAEGTGKQGAVPGRPTAGKTGTTELPETREFAGINGGAKDLWFTGYTPELTGSVWIGYDRTDREHYMKTTSAAAAAVFREIMTRALSGTPPTAFVVPPGFRADWEREEEKQKKQEKKEGKREKSRKKKDRDERKADEGDDEEERKGRGDGKKRARD